MVGTNWNRSLAGIAAINLSTIQSYQYCYPERDSIPHETAFPKVLPVTLLVFGGWSFFTVHRFCCRSGD